MQVPAPFEYARATSVDEAIELLTSLGPEARLVAGGHSLLPMMKLRLATPEHLIDINPLEEQLGYIHQEGDEIRIGAMTRHRDLLESELLADVLPIVREAEYGIADPPVRNRGTIGGALCQADPSEDLSAVCAALNASVVIKGAGGERTVDMVEFHRGPYETAVGDGEMLLEVRIPLREHHGGAYRKVKRRAGDWAVAASAATIWMNGEGIKDVGIALSAVNPKAVRSTRAEEALRGQPPSDENLAAAAALAAEDCDPVSDQRGPSEYKRHLAHELTLRALRAAVAQSLA
jgi:carbon-monoxide dehydrogenase medium subunit